MTPLEELRAVQHNDRTYTSEHQFAAFMAGLDPEAVQLEHAAHATPIEQRMLAATRGVA